MGSGMFAEEFRKARAEGRAEGQAEGQAKALREAVLDVVRHHHPAVAAGIAPLVATCSSLPLLRRWILKASELSDEELVRLVTGSRAAKTDASRQRRAPRPSKRTTSRRR